MRVAQFLLLPLLILSFIPSTHAMSIDWAWEKLAPQIDGETLHIFSNSLASIPVVVTAEQVDSLQLKWRTHITSGKLSAPTKILDEAAIESRDETEITRTFLLPLQLSRLERKSTITIEVLDEQLKLKKSLRVVVHVSSPLEQLQQVTKKYPIPIEKPSEKSSALITKLFDRYGITWISKSEARFRRDLFPLSLVVTAFSKQHRLQPLRLAADFQKRMPVLIHNQLFLDADSVEKNFSNPIFHYELSERLVAAWQSNHKGLRGETL